MEGVAMYDPLALDRQRIDQDRLRRRAETAWRRFAVPATDIAKAAEVDTDVHRRSFLRVALAGVGVHHRPAKPCTDC
jgi:hypothetical protein